MGRKLVSELIQGFDHFSLGVKNLTRSDIFYGEILGFEKLPRPDFDFPGSWYKIGPGIALHLIENPIPYTPQGGSRHLHFAFGVYDFDAFVQYIDAAHGIVKGPKTRPDGIRQVFITDPDGYYLEFCEILTPEEDPLASDQVQD